MQQELVRGNVIVSIHTHIHTYIHTYIRICVCVFRTRNFTVATNDADL